MKKIRIQFDTVSAAFEDSPGEVDRILLQVHEKVQRHQMSGDKKAEFSLLDINGNTVGKVKIT